MGKVRWCACEIQGLPDIHLCDMSFCCPTTEENKRLMALSCCPWFGCLRSHPVDCAPSFAVSVHRGGVDFSNLCLLNRAVPLASENRTYGLALINARLLASKNDFLNTKELDFMLLLETWLHGGELKPFSELLHPQYNTLSYSWTASKGGGIASVFKSTFHCHEVPFDSCSSLELQLFGTNFPVCSGLPSSKV